MLRRLFFISLAWLVSSQDQECSQQGGAVCCALKYDGSRNFYNTALGRCEVVVDTCTTKEEYDPATNTCVDVTSALEAQTESQSSPLQGLVQATTSSAAPVDCGAHGSPDPSDASQCICDSGWTSSVLAHGPPCNTPVIEQSQSIDFGNPVNGTVTVSQVVKQTSVMGTMMANGGPLLIIALLILCSCCCCGSRLYLRRTSSKAMSSPAPLPWGSWPQMSPSLQGQQTYEWQQEVFRQQQQQFAQFQQSQQSSALPPTQFRMPGQWGVGYPGDLSPTSYPPQQFPAFALPPPIAGPLVPPRKSTRQSRRT